MDNNHT